MAWFKKTLEDMKKAIELENWLEVEEILKQHNRSLDKDALEVRYNLHEIGKYYK